MGFFPFQVPKCLLSFNPPIILQGIPNDLTCFLNVSLQFNKSAVILLSPYDPREAAS